MSGGRSLKPNNIAINIQLDEELRLALARDERLKEHKKLANEASNLSVERVKDLYKLVSYLISKHQKARAIIKESKDKKAIGAAKSSLLEEEQLLLLERYKLTLLTGLRQGLQDTVATKLAPHQREKQNEMPVSSKVTTAFKHVALVGVSALVLGAICTEVFISMLASLPEILVMVSNPVISAISIGVTCISALLVAFFELKLIQDFFGVHLFRNVFKERLQCEAENIKQVKQLKQIESHILDPGLKAELNEITGLLSKDVESLVTYRKGYETPTWKKMAKYAIGFFGVATHAASGFFLGKALIALTLGAGALFTPPGLVILGVGIAAFIALYAFTEFGSLGKQLNPAEKAYHNLEGAYDSYKKSEYRIDIGQQLELANQSQRTRRERSMSLPARPLSQCSPISNQHSSAQASTLFGSTAQSRQLVSNSIHKPGLV